jgi:hypothetical protein
MVVQFINCDNGRVKDAFSAFVSGRKSRDMYIEKSSDYVLISDKIRY